MSDESERVKKYKRSKMKEGHKNISFIVSPEEFKLIKKARKYHQMSTRELLIYFVSNQYNKDIFQGFDEMENFNLKLTQEERYQKQHDEYGTAHKIIGKKKYVLLTYLSVDRKKIRIIKDFDNYDKAVEYYKKRNYKRRVELYFRHDENSYWYG